MSLVLSLVLEYSDTSTLLDCMFLNKHIHEVVMRILKPKFAILNQLDKMLGDVYIGIKLLDSTVDIQVTQYKNSTLLNKFIEEYKSNCSGLIEIYTRLYRINIGNGSLSYRCFIGDKFLGLMVDLSMIVRNYWYKIRPYTMGLIVHGAFTFEDYHWIIEYILDKGLNVNYMLHIQGFSRTILIHAIVYQKLWAVDLILNKNPNLFVEDCQGGSAIYYFRDYKNVLLPGDNPFTLSVIKKFNMLKEQQMGARKLWL